jgi:FkbM family methyltransferase
MEYNKFFHHRKDGEFKGQLLQDKYLDENVFNGKKNGIFVEVGALDGIGASNTLFFEEKRNWKGILIEPNPVEYVRLIESKRNSIFENCAISNLEGEVNFLSISGPCNVLSGILEFYDPRHLQRIQYELNQYSNYKIDHELYSTSETVKIKSKKLSTVFKENNYTHIDLLSVDVEGAEMEVLKSINFDEVNIDCILLENNYGIEKETEFLIANGYRVLTNIQWDVLFIKNDFII